MPGHIPTYAAVMLALGAAALSAGITMTVLKAPPKPACMSVDVATGKCVGASEEPPGSYKR